MHYTIQQEFENKSNHHKAFTKHTKTTCKAIIPLPSDEWIMELIAFGKIANLKQEYNTKYPKSHKNTYK
jgi:hypothetical protein